MLCVGFSALYKLLAAVDEKFGLPSSPKSTKEVIRVVSVVFIVDTQAGSQSETGGS